MKQPRCIAICYIRDGNRLFVGDGYDPKKNKRFCRPLGGAIEWGESAANAVAREFKEEMNAELVNVRFETVIENVFTFNGVDGHEIALVFSADFRDRAFYQMDVVACVEDNGIPFNGMWIDANNLDPEMALYPDGLLEHLRRAES